MPPTFPPNKGIEIEDTGLGYHDAVETDYCNNCGHYSLEYVRKVGDGLFKYKCHKCDAVEIRS